MVDRSQDGWEDAEDGTREFRVEDRRSFTPEGKRRPGTERDSHARPSAPSGPEERAAGEAEENPFIRLVGGLAAGAYMALGLVQGTGPEGTEVDLSAAKEAIDLLTALQEKTRGNLEPPEQDLLDQQLTELRFLFLRRTQEGTPG